MDKRIERILSSIKSHVRFPFAYNPLADMAELLSVISEQQAQAADKMEKHTRKLVFLTWALLVLTATLLVYTVILYQDAPTQTQGNHTTNHCEKKMP